MSLPEPLNPIAWLEGRWASKEGRGTYPNIPEFEYHDEMEFVCVGQPMFNYSSTSKHPERQTPMHQERGFLRIKPGTNELALVVSHNFGLTSIEGGNCNPETKEIQLETISLARISFAKPPVVKKVKRTLKLLAPDTLEAVLFMETEDTPMTEHLKATYKKVQA